jgi:nitrogen-specific signal transduction histidine kinase
MLRLRLDSAHGVSPSVGELNWSTQVGLPIPMDPSAISLADCSIDCCSATAQVPNQPLAQVTVNAQSKVATQALANTVESQAFGARYRAMLAEAAHDIRAPLGVARQILNRIASRVREDGILSNQDQRLLAAANDRLEQATTWVDGILLPNRLQQTTVGTMRKRFYPHQLRGVVEPVVNELANQRNVELDWVGWDRSLPRLYLDPNQLGRILLNLISNAIAASPRGSRLSLRIAWQTNVTQRLVIAVEDEGRGLSASLLRFVNSAQAVQAPADAGIGLKTVKSLIGAIGGAISAQVGQLGGTLFRVTVPVDNRLSLVRGWLIQQSQAAERGAKTTLNNIQLHLLRSAGLETTVVDQWLQQSAAPEDFVYRVSEDRWLWLSIGSQAGSVGGQTSGGATAALNKYSALVQAQQGQLNCHLAAEWLNIELQSLHSTSNQRNLLPHLATAIADKFAALAGNRIPPINELKDAQRVPSKPQGRYGDLLRVDDMTSQLPKAKLRPVPRERVNLLTADPAIFAELAQDWREQHSQL